MAVVGGQPVDRPGGDSSGNIGGDFGSRLFQPMGQQLEENVLDGTLRQRLELLMWLGTFAVHVGKELAHRDDQIP